MKSQKIQLFILLICLIVFASGYFGLKAYNKRAEAKESEPRYTALSISENTDVTSLKVVNSNGEFEVVKDGEEWKFKDSDEDIDEDKLAKKINCIKGITSDQIIEKADNLADYGLDNPSIIITASLSDGSSHKIKVGSYNSAANKYYLSVDDDSVVYTVDSSIHTNYQFTLDEIKTKADNKND
ncbi:DUF4340 domain-containing protein [Butyrivibrio sp. AE3004]|uniref:DUF4340 domain-containing protein n=1 Tax=Butyrivibrio sp. AE3004 TaxID=1506994 RepID=UPI00049496D0|nr:DUF4340 domain-containing protein [Butyrivibrio sp. AE3004]